MQDVPEHEVLKTPQERPDPINVSNANGYSTPPHTPPGNLDIHQALPEADADDDEPYDDVQIIEQQPVVHSIQTVQPVTSQVISKARLVTVPKRMPPKLPPRNPGRNAPVVVDASTKSRTPSPTNSASSISADAGSASPAFRPVVVDAKSPEQGSAVPEEDSANAGSSKAHNGNEPPVSGERAIASANAQDAKTEDHEEREIARPDSLSEVGESRNGDHATHDTQVVVEKMPGGFD